MPKTNERRFEVDTEGFAALHGGREPWELVKELVANAWDEDITECFVDVEPHGRAACITVQDDGPGFANIEDAWTLFRHTPKRGRPEVRGRFNVGEKEILSVASSAQIVTSGRTITFPKSGGRTVSRTPQKTDGTVIQVIIDWTAEQRGGLIAMLQRFIPPPGTVFRVNGAHIIRPRTVTMTDAVLPSVIQSGPGEPLRPTHRKTCITILEAPDGDAWLYEMGIPIQPIACEYHVDIGQKVPMSQNRNSVRDAYIRDVYAEVLNATADRITEANAAATWVRQAVEDDRSTDEAVAAVRTARYGENAVLWSSDPQANEAAYAAGYDVIHPRTMSPAERERMTSAGDAPMKRSSEVFRGNDQAKVQTCEPDAYMTGVAAHAAWLGSHLLGYAPAVRFVESSQPLAAWWDEGTITFNVSRLGATWFAPDNVEGHDELILHELAHDGPSVDHHRGGFVDRLPRLAAQMATLARRVGEAGWKDSYRSTAR